MVLFVPAGDPEEVVDVGERFLGGGVLVPPGTEVCSDTQTWHSPDQFDGEGQRLVVADDEDVAGPGTVLGGDFELVAPALFGRDEPNRGCGNRYLAHDLMMHLDPYIYCSPRRRRA